jgi:hypothetical protein
MFGVKSLLPQTTILRIGFSLMRCRGGGQTHTLIFPYTHPPTCLHTHAVSHAVDLGGVCARGQMLAPRTPCICFVCTGAGRCPPPALLASAPMALVRANARPSARPLP